MEKNKFVEIVDQLQDYDKCIIFCNRRHYNGYVLKYPNGASYFAYNNDTPMLTLPYELSLGTSSDLYTKLNAHFKQNYNYTSILLTNNTDVYLGVDEIDDIVYSGNCNINVINREINNNIKVLIDNNIFLYASIKSIVSYFEQYPALLKWGITLIKNYNDISIGQITYVYSFYKNYKHLIKDLVKKTITAYTTKEAFLELLLEIKYIKNNNSLFKIIKLFNTEQRKMLLETSITPSQKLLFCQFEKIDKIKQMNFIKKISATHNLDEFFYALTKFTDESFVWDYTDFVNYITNNSYNKLNFVEIYNNSEQKVVILEILDFQTIAILGAKTSWCISRSEYSWNSYCEENKGHQYVLFDFNQSENSALSMYGFTLSKNKNVIIHAHDYCNDVVLYNYNIFLDPNSKHISINKKLAQFNIEPSLIFNLNYKKPNYDWNYKSMIQYLINNNIPSFDIIYNEETNTCLVENINYRVYKLIDFSMIGHQYTEDMTNATSFIIIDFNKSYNEENAIYSIHISKYRYNKNVLFTHVMNNFGHYDNVNPYDLLKKYKLDYIEQYITDPTILLYKSIIYDSIDEVKYIVQTNTINNFYYNEIFIDYTDVELMSYIINNDKFEILEFLIKNNIFDKIFYHHMKENIVTILVNIFNYRNSNVPLSYFIKWTKLILSIISVSQKHMFLYKILDRENCINGFKDVIDIILSDPDINEIDECISINSYLNIPNTNIVGRILYDNNLSWLRTYIKNSKMKNYEFITPSVILIFEKRLTQRKNKLLDELSEEFVQNISLYKEKYIREIPNFQQRLNDSLEDGKLKKKIN